MAISPCSLSADAPCLCQEQHVTKTQCLQQIGVGEAGGLTKLLGMARSDNLKAAAAAAKALGGVVMRSRVMQESLLDAGGVEALVQLLASFPTTTTGVHLPC